MPKANVIYSVQAIASAARGSGKAEREVGRRLLSPVLQARARAAEAAQVDRLREALAARGVLPPDAVDGQAVLDGFEAAYDARPLKDNAGGTMRNSSLWVYAVARLLAPPMIMESGTYLGHSAWLMKQAAPAARIVTFDVVREGRRLTTPGIDYRIGDWSDAPDLDPLPEGALCVFDDHISHRRRLEEARARGVRLALVDDDYPATALYATGSPPVPTVAMLTDPDLAPGTDCVWERPGKRYSYTFTAADRRAAERLVAWAEPMPDLSRLNHFVPQAPITLVGLA